MKTTKGLVMALLLSSVIVMMTACASGPPKQAQNIPAGYGLVVVNKTAPMLAPFKVYVDNQDADSSSGGNKYYFRVPNGRHELKAVWTPIGGGLTETMSFNVNSNIVYLGATLVVSDYMPARIDLKQRKTEPLP